MFERGVREYFSLMLFQSYSLLQHTFEHQHSNTGTFSARAMDHLANMLMIRDGNDSKIERNLRFLRSALDMCRQQWTAFDWASIALGLAIMFLSACVMMMYSTSLHSSSPSKVKNKATRPMNILSSIVLVSLCVSFTSNSLVNAGAETTGFFLATTLCLIGVEMSKRRRGVQFEILLILGLVRLSSEYVSYRRNVGGPLGCSEPVSMLHSVCPVVIIWLMLVLSCKQYEDKFRIVISLVSMLIVCVFWFEDSFQGQDEDSVLPRIVLFLSVLGLVPCRRSSNRDTVKLKLLCMIPVVLLSMGPRSPLSILLLVCTGLGFLRLVERDKTTTSPFACALFWCLLGYHGFFTTGHTAEFASLQHSCGFVGMTGFDPVISPFWVRRYVFLPSFAQK